MQHHEQPRPADEEALIPIRVRKNKPKKKSHENAVLVLTKKMQRISAQLNAFKQEPGNNNELQMILNKNYTNRGLPFLDTPSLLAYSAISKQAYISAHEHPISRLRFFSVYTQQQLSRAKKLSDRADLVIRMTDPKNQTPTRHLGLSTSSWISIALFIPIMTPFFATIIRFLIKSTRQGNYNDNTEDLTPVFISLGIALISIPLILFIVYPMLKNYLTRIKENHKNDADLLGQLHDALEENNLAALQKILGEHTQGDETKTLTDDNDSLKMETGLPLFAPPKATGTQLASEKTGLLREGGQVRTFDI